MINCTQDYIIILNKQRSNYFLYFILVIKEKKKWWPTGPKVSGQSWLHGFLIKVEVNVKRYMDPEPKTTSQILINDDSCMFPKCSKLSQTCGHEVLNNINNSNNNSSRIKKKEVNGHNFFLRFYLFFYCISQNFKWHGSLFMIN